MSSDSNDTGSTWQEPTAPRTNRNQAQEQIPASDQEEKPPSGRQQRGALNQTTSDAIRAANARRRVAGINNPASRPTSTPFELFKQFGQYFTLIIIPLLFGALTCLIVLPSVLAGKASLQAEGFWPILLVILAITIAQGVTIYYAGSDNGMGALGTAGGFCLFLLVGCFALYGPIPGFLLLAALVIIGVVLARRSVHPVPQGFVDIVFAAKKYRRTLYPGFNILLPWETVSTQLNTEEIQWICPAQVVQLSHDEDVMLRAVISYQLLQEDAYLAVTQIKNWEESLRTLFATTLQSIATVFAPDDFTPWSSASGIPPTAQPGDDDFTGSFERRQAINTYLFHLVRDKVALWGVQINWVSIRDIELAPHGTLVINERPTAKPKAEPTPEPKQAAPVEAKAQNIKPRPVVAPAKAHTTPKPAEQPPAATQATVPDYQLKEDVLIQAYKTVQNGQVTDPETIRHIAAKFEMVAQDPEINQTISFDAQRAALNLYDQARKYEEQYEQARKYDVRHMYSDDTQPDWVAPANENQLAEGQKATKPEG